MHCVSVGRSSRSGRSRKSEVNPEPGRDRERTAEQVTLAEQFGTLGRGGLPTDHLVGSGPELSEQVVMVVRVEELDPRAAIRWKLTGLPRIITSAH